MLMGWWLFRLSRLWRVPPLADDFLGTNETYAVKILSAPMSFDSLMGNLCLSPGVRSCFFPAAC
jgi:hypothetical protein